MFENKKHIECQKYLIGGIDEISKFISKLYSLKIEKVKKQFIRKSVIKITDLNDFISFDGSCFEPVIKSLASNIIGEGSDCNYNYVNDSIKSKYLSFDGNSHYDTNKTVSAKKMIQMSNLEDDEKKEILKAIDNFNMEIDIIDELNNLYETVPNFELLEIISYVKDENIELPLRLSDLAAFMTKLNKSIIQNDDLLKSRSYKHKKTCASIINTNLHSVAKEIKSELKYYLDLLNNEYQNISDDRQPREFLLHSLIENSKKMDLFLRYEKELLERKYLSNEFSKWYKTPIELVKFYRFCEVNKIFRLHFEKNSKGVKLFREMYNFKDGITIDKPIKRKKYTQVKQDYFFLNHII